MRKSAGVSFIGLVGAGLLALPLGGCGALAITALSAGASAGLNKTINGYAYRTFTAPAPNVKQAAVAALNRMGIKIEVSLHEGAEEIIRARTNQRDIEISLETLSPNTTRMRAVARQGIIVDGATSLEIVVQTEKALAKA